MTFVTHMRPGCSRLAWTLSLFRPPPKCRGSAETERSSWARAGADGMKPVVAVTSHRYSSTPARLGCGRHRPTLRWFTSDGRVLERRLERRAVEGLIAPTSTWPAVAWKVTAPRAQSNAPAATSSPCAAMRPIRRHQPIPFRRDAARTDVRECPAPTSSSVRGETCQLAELSGRVSTGTLPIIRAASSSDPDSIAPVSAERSACSWSTAGSYRSESHGVPSQRRGQDRSSGGDACWKPPVTATRSPPCWQPRREKPRPAAGIFSRFAPTHLIGPASNQSAKMHRWASRAHLRI
jgi:hypothetical protein